MTSATKRKHVVKEMLDDFSLPEDCQQIVKVLGTPGSNLHEVITTKGEKMLCSLPVKFRKNIWIKRGNFVVIEPIEEGDKVKAEIVRILCPQHIKSLEKEGNWPVEFRTFDDSALKHAESLLKKSNLNDKNIDNYILDDNSKTTDVNNDFSSEDEDDLSDIPANTNRPIFDEECTTSDSEGGDDW